MSMCDNFMSEFKRVKHLSEEGIRELTKDSLKDLRCVKLESCDEKTSYTRSFHSWKVFESQKIPGFILIKDIFRSEFLVDLMTKSLTDYPNKADVKTNLTRCPNSKLRWATLGYHYDWDNKCYYKDDHGYFPTELCTMSNFLARLFAEKPDFYSDSAIINYYPLKSTLCPHVDIYESDLSMPLVTLSLGCSGVLQMGGSTRNDVPLSFLIHHGDVVIMCGKSRSAVHAVPRILSHVECMEDIDALSEHSKKFFTTHRVNISIRQVF